MITRRHAMIAATCVAMLLAVPAPSRVAAMHAYQPAGNPATLRTVAAAPTITFKQVHFVNTLQGVGVHGRSVAKIAYDPNTPPGNYAPAHIAFNFSNYYPTLFAPQSVVPPTLAIYPVGSFREYHWDADVTALQRILQTHPDLGKRTMLPYLPQFPAGQVLHARAAYLLFQSGSGIVYLTYYAQDVSPVTANRLFYTFQGLTSNGKYYVSASFPVHIRFLPNEIPANLDFTAFNKNYTSYLAKLVARLNTPGALKSITPSLPQVDQLLRSITVTS